MAQDATPPLAAASTAKILLVNHFRLRTVSGTTVMFDELLRLAPAAAPAAKFVYESLDLHPSAAALRQRLDETHRDTQCLIAVNAHIEVFWELSQELFRWSGARRVPAYVYVHDYWTHHRRALKMLVGLGAKPIASTRFIAESLSREGIVAEVIEVGVPLIRGSATVPHLTDPLVVASAGRLVPRKRFVDVVDAFARAKVEPQVALYLRVLPSGVFAPAADRQQLQEIRTAIDRWQLRCVTLDTEAADRPPYGRYAAYACPSSYEGFSMAVIESAYEGCPPLMSDLPPHVRIADYLFGSDACAFLFPTADVGGLAGLIGDEIATGRRRAMLAGRLDEIRDKISRRWSLAHTARALAVLARA